MNQFETAGGPVLLQAISGDPAGRYLRKAFLGWRWVTDPAQATVFDTPAAAYQVWRGNPALLRYAATTVPAPGGTS